MTTVELRDTVGTDEDLEHQVALLAEENRSLRSYLHRVLEMLDGRIAEDESADVGAETEAPVAWPEPEAEAAAPEVGHQPEPEATAAALGPRGEVTGPAGGVAMVRVADVERRLHRAEETIEDVLWILTRMDQAALEQAASGPDGPI